MLWYVQYSYTVKPYFSFSAQETRAKLVQYQDFIHFLGTSLISGTGTDKNKEIVCLLKVIFCLVSVPQKKYGYI